jgi:hypothetical protein
VGPGADAAAACRAPARALPRTLVCARFIELAPPLLAREHAITRAPARHAASPRWVALAAAATVNIRRHSVQRRLADVDNALRGAFPTSDWASRSRRSLPAVAGGPRGQVGPDPAAARAFGYVTGGSRSRREVGSR